MGMNNVWYPFVEMAERRGPEDAARRAAHERLRDHGGVDKKKFEAYALAASIVGKCHFCVASHYALLKKEGLTTQQLRDIGRIAAVVNAAAQVIAAEAERLAATTGSGATTGPRRASRRGCRARARSRSARSRPAGSR